MGEFLKIRRFFTKQRLNRSPDSHDVDVNRPSGSRDVGMNQPSGSRDVGVNQPSGSRDVGVNQPSGSRDVGVNQPSGSRDVGVNQPSGSRDVGVNQPSGSHDVAVNQPSLCTPPKKASLWKRLKQKCRRRAKSGERCDNVEHTMKRRLNRSPDSHDVDVNRPSGSRDVGVNQPSRSHDVDVNQPSGSRDVGVNQPSGSHDVDVNQPSGSHDVDVNQPSGSHDVDVNQPSLSSPHKASLWKRLKQKCRRRAKSGERCDNVENTMQSRMTKPGDAQIVGVNQPASSTATRKTTFWKRQKNSQPRVSKRSFKENLFTDDDCEYEDDDSQSIKHNEDDSSEEKENDVGRLFYVGDWKAISPIGHGGFAIVYEGRNVKSAEVAALKKAKDPNRASSLLNEAEIMRSLDHPNIVKLLHAYNYTVSKLVVLVLEYVDGESLFEKLLSWGKLSEKQAWPLMVQMAAAVDHMHSHNIVHRDIKLQKIIYSPPGILKIIDFGLATRFKSGQLLYDFAGTRGYMAPEISQGGQCGYEGPPVDVWSLGILFMKLLVGEHFHGDDILEPMTDDSTDFEVVFQLPPFAKPLLGTLLTWMLCKDPVDRLTMQEIMKYKLIKRFPLKR